MITLQLDIAQTVGIAAVLLVVGDFIKKHVSVLERYFIPGPIIGGVLFSLIALVGHETNSFTFVFYDNMRAFLLLVFFTTIGFSASFELLKKGGIGVALFLAAAVGLVVIQNTLGAALASVLGGQSADWLGGRLDCADRRAWHLSGVWPAARTSRRGRRVAGGDCGGHVWLGGGLLDWRPGRHAVDAAQRPQRPGAAGAGAVQ